MFFVVDFGSLLIFSIFLPLFVHLFYILSLKIYLFTWLHQVLEHLRSLVEARELLVAACGM